MKLIADSLPPERIHPSGSFPSPGILVIDDDPIFQTLLSKSFSPSLEVYSALSGRGGLDLLADSGSRIDCVLLDYQLPGVDGITVLGKIREVNPDIPVIFMTGFGDLELVKRALHGGANEYIPKPALPAELFSAISNWIPDLEKDLRFEKHEPPLRRPKSDPGNSFSAVQEGGKRINGRILRFGTHYVVVDLDVWPLRILSLTDIEMGLGRFSMFVESATILEDKKSLGHSVKISLPGHWHVESGNGVDQEAPSFSEKLISSPAKIPSGLKSAVSDLAAMLSEMHGELESLEDHINEWTEHERASLEHSFIAQAEKDYFPVIDSAIARFEKETALLTPAQDIEFAPQIRDALYPLVLASPFMSRVIEKPIGVPGDFGMLGQILGDPFDGNSLYARTLNGWILKSRAAGAYRYRVDLLSHHIRKIVKQANREGRRAEILSVGSGVAYEVQRYIAQHGETEVDFNLLDYSTETLKEANRLIDLCVADSGSYGVNVKIHQGTILDLVTDSRNGETKFEGSGEFDFVYCTGLFDYLSDRLCREVTGYLSRLTRSQGKIAVSNYMPGNPIRRFMDLVLDWKLIYRDLGQFEEILNLSDTQSRWYSVFDEPGGVEVYGIIEKR